MKEVLKVSVARVSFTFEKGACIELEQYLDKLREYYKMEVGREEIIDDIEERVAELIIERGGKEKVVTIGDIESIINILGKPYETDGEPFGTGGSFTKEGAKRSLYRDTTNRVIGGVCSGFAAYFKFDLVWTRIVFILLFLVTSTPFIEINHLFSSHIRWVPFMLLIYVVLWIIIPPAKTVSQKCAMHGESPSINEIERKFREGVRNVSNDVRDFGARRGGGFFNTLGRVILFCIGAILSLIALSGIIGGWLLFLGIDLGGISCINMVDYIQLNINNTIWLKIAAIMTYFLPFIGMLYAGICLCFGFKGPSWKPGVIIFVLWIVSLLMFMAIAFTSFKPYYHNHEVTDNMPLVKNYDTLYVKYNRVAEIDQSKMYINANSYSLDLFYINKINRKEKEFIVYPSLYINRQSVEEQPKLECDMDYFTNLSMFSGIDNKLRIADVVTVQDSLITVEPRMFSKTNKFKGNFQSIRIFVPNSTVVILQDPIDHVFEDGQHYKSSNWFRNF
ncbi:MAG: PspC domain-containing protein [Bacteroidales bacterium]